MTSLENSSLPPQMKAAIWTQYGAPEVLRIEQSPTPLPKDDEVCIRIHASSVTAGDCEARRFDFPALFWLPLRLYMGFRKPRIKILGQEFAGEVVRVGKKVTRFKVGDKVFGPVDMNFGAYAEYICISASYAITNMPQNMSFEEAATIPTGGLNAYYFIEKANIQPGQKVLIIGAGGSIGTIAIQLAKLHGAEVTAIDSTSKLSMLQEIGADHVIDYTQEDFTQKGEHYDVILDIVGKSSFSGCVRSLSSKGSLLIANPRLSKMVRGLAVSLMSRKKVMNVVADYKIEAIDRLKNLIEAGHLKTVIDRSYPLEQLVEAHRYVETGQKAGNVAITI